MAAMFAALRAADDSFQFPVPNPDSLENPERLARELRKHLGEDVWSERSTVALAYLQRELGDRPNKLSTTAWLGFGIRPRD